MWRPLSLSVSVIILRAELKNDRNMENEGPDIRTHFQTKAHTFPGRTCKPIWMTGKRLSALPSPEAISDVDQDERPFHWSQPSLNTYKLTVHSLFTRLNQSRNNNNNNKRTASSLGLALVRVARPTSRTLAVKSSADIPECLHKNLDHARSAFDQQSRPFRPFLWHEST